MMMMMMMKNVNLSRSLLNSCVMQLYLESEKKHHAFLILPLDGDEVSHLHRSCFTCAKTVPATHRIKLGTHL